jgi:hypothetical protein
LVPRNRLDLDLSAVSCGFLRTPSATSLHLWLHPPASFTPPPEYCGKLPAPCAPKNLAAFRRPKSASHGVPIPSSRHQLAASTIARESQPELKFRPRRFSRPRRFAPPPALRVYCTPQPRPGFALQGFVPRTEPYRISPASSCPLAVERCRLRFDPRQRPRPRLQGLALRVECGVNRNRLRPRSIRAPPGLLLLRVLSPRTVGAPSRSLRPRPFTAVSPPQLALSVLPVRGPVFLYPGHRPARGFCLPMFRHCGQLNG